MSATARYHSAAFNSSFNDYPPDKNFHALDEEDEDVDNWRNVLVYTSSQYQPSDMVGISLHLKYDRDLGNHWWAYSDIEWLKQHYNYTDRSNLFYKIGIQYEWEANQLVYAGIQNKLFSTTFQETYKNFDPLFMEVSPFVVMGLKYRF